MLKYLFIAVFVTCFAFTSWAQAGSLDPSFGINGINTYLPQPVFNKAYSTLIQPDQKILVAGYSLAGSANVFSLARLESNGNLDITFGNNGFVEIPIAAGASCYAAALQVDGKIVLAGSAVSLTNGASDFAATRLLPTGTLDSTFSDDGIQIISIATGDDFVRAITLQSDGKILLAGTSTNSNGSLMALARLQTNGALDPTFSGDGKTTLGIGTIFTNAFAMALQEDGKIVLAGLAKFGMADDIALARFLPNGTPDPSFGSAGHLSTDLGSDADIANAVTIQSDGKILVGGITGTSRDFALLRYNPSGTLDLNFGNQGVTTTDFYGSDDYANSIGVQSDGKIILGGYAYVGTKPDFAVAWYTANGENYFGFGGQGKFVTDFGDSYDYSFSMNLQQGDKVLLCGYSFSNGHTAFALARYFTGFEVGISELPPLQLVALAPNPVQDQAELTFETLSAMDLSLSLLDVKGSLMQTFFSGKNFGVGTQSETLYFRRDLPGGSYWLELRGAGQPTMLKILKK